MEIITLKGGEVEVQGVPEVIRILPLGHVTSQKGEFDVDEESLRLMKAEIARHGVDVVVDYDGDGTHATPEQARAIARKMIASYKDWGDGDYDALVWLWNKESGWQWNATNPSSGAYGIPQALPASKLASAGDDWKDNAATQIKWGLNYIAGRYGSPSAAKTFWLAHNWY